MPDTQTSFWTPARIGAVIGAVLLVALTLTCGCTGTTPDPTGATTPPATLGAATPTADMRDYTFTQTITYSSENGTTVIAKNKLTKTATVDIAMHLAPAPEGFDRTRYNELAAGVTGGVLQMALFNETALDEFNARIEEWNTQQATVEDDSPPEQQETEPGDNPLDGYTVQRATVRLTERGTGAGIAEIVITGPDKEDLAITYL